MEGFEPPTSRLEILISSTTLHPPKQVKNYRAIYDRGEMGQGDAYRGGEREGKTEQREST